MRITYISAVHDIRDTRVFDRVCVSLAKKHRVALIARHPHDDCRKGVRIRALPTFRSRLVRMTFGSLWAFLRAMHTPTDVYVTIPPENLWVALALKMLTRRCVFHEMHEHFELEIAQRSYLPSWLTGAAIRFYKAVWRTVAPRLDGLIAATPRIAAEIAPLNPNTFAVNNYPLPVTEEPAPVGERERAVCYVGKMTRERGVLELIQAMEHIDGTLHLVGEFEPPELETEARALTGWSKARLHGFLPFDEAKQVMRRCAVGAVTFLPGGQNEISFPNKLFDYMAMGLPQAASDFANWRELAGDGGSAVFVDPTDPQDIARGVNEVLDDPTRQRRMIDAGRRMHLERFNWTSEEQRLLDRLERTATRVLRTSAHTPQS